MSSHTLASLGVHTNIEGVMTKSFNEEKLILGETSVDSVKTLRATECLIALSVS